jgi:hypothetical protein
MQRVDWQPAGSNFVPPPCRVASLFACGANCYVQSANNNMEAYYFEDVGPNSVWKLVDPLATEYGYRGIDTLGAGPNSTAVITNGATAFRFDKTTCLGMVRTPNDRSVRFVGVGDCDNFVFSDYDDNLYKYVNGVITQLPVANSRTHPLRQLACVSALDHIWAITDQPGSNVFYWSNAWLPIYGKNLRKIDLHYNPITDKLVVAGVDDNYVGWLYDNMTNIWTEVEKHSEYDFVSSLSTSNNYIFSATEDPEATTYRGVLRN